MHPLEAFFHPKIVAVIGAKDDEGSVGRTIMRNLIDGGFSGRVVPVNPHRREVCGLPAFRLVGDVGERVDLAVIAVPAPRVVAAMESCAAAKVRAAIVISAGFKELGEEGALLEEEVTRIARSGGVRMIGPNCLGLMNPWGGLNASFAHGMPLPGSIAFISQSGALCTAVLDWSLSQGMGFSSFVSIGSMADVDWGELIEYFGKDPVTNSILIYMETVGDPRSFLGRAKEVALDKPIVVIKPGKSAEASRAAASHTGALTGSDKAFDAACERVGVLRVETIAQLFDVAEVMAWQPKALGPRVCIVTNAGGPAVLATDAVVKHGAEMANLTKGSLEKLESFLPPAWSHANPVDVLGDADPKRYDQALEVVIKDVEVDGAIVVLTPQDMTDSTGSAEIVRERCKKCKKPILTSWMGGTSVQEGRSVLFQAKVPCFNYPDEAAWCFATMWKHTKMLRNLYMPPRSLPHATQEEAEKRKKKAEQIITQALSRNETVLSERVSKELLQMYGILSVETVLARTPKEAVQKASKIGFPVVLKVESAIVTHKSDVGGVKIGLANSTQVEEAFKSIEESITARFGKEAFQGVSVQKMIETRGIELIIGSSTDPQLGPVILFGAGGVMVEAFNDNALGLPPLNSNIACEMIEKTKISNVLKGFRGQSQIPYEPIEDMLILLSEMVLDLPQIFECDMNPVLASSSGVFCLDARIVLSKERASPAFRPYPREYERTSGNIFVRPIRMDDANNVASFHERLSNQPEYADTFNHPLFSGKIVTSELMKLCTNLFDGRMVLIAEDGKGLVGMANVQMTPSKGWDLWIGVDTSVGMQAAEDFLTILLGIVKEENVSSLQASIANSDTWKSRLLEGAGFVKKSTHKERTDFEMVF